MDSPWRLCAMAASVLALAGCEQAPTLLTWSPAPASQHVIANSAAPAAGVPYPPPGERGMHPIATGAKTAPRWPPNPIAGNPATVLVRRGETLYDISRRYHVPLRLLLDANRLNPPYHILAGQRLVLPKPKTHVVQPGETLYGLSRRYHVGLYEIANANDILAPYRLQADTILVIPPPEGGPPAPPIERQPPPMTALPVVAAVARTATPLPLAAPQRRATPAPARPTVHETDLNPNHAGRRDEERHGNGRRSNSAERATPAVATRLEAPRDHRHPFLWPVKGRLLVGFGPESNGLDNDGINIAVPEGTPVRAAAAGTVVYAGNQLKGYGNLILIRHADGWITAYAHNAKLLVRRGQRVARGEIIARAGETGGVASPQLHFEIRQGARPVDPLRYLSALPKTSATRAG